MIEIRYLDGTIKKAEFSNLKKLLRFPVWVDCTNITKEESENLRKEFGLHSLTTEDLYNSNTRIKIEEFSEYLFSVFYNINEQHELMEMDFIIGKNFLITNHKKPIETFETLKKDEEKLSLLFKKGLDFLFHRLLDKEIDEYFTAIEKLEDNIEQLEEAAINRARPELLSRILKLKRMVVHIKRVTTTQRDKTGLLAKSNYKQISKRAEPYFRDIYDHAIRVSDIIDNNRESIGNAFDVYMSTMSNNMNEVMKVLSIIATIALPLTVISGIYGTNFTILPGASFPYGFWSMILVMILMGLGMMWFFKKRNWF
jgi:magnesium transporter